MAEIRLSRSRTQLADPEEAAEALICGLEGGEPGLVTLFAARDRDQRALNQAVRRRLPARTRLIGATTSGEVDNDGVHSGGVVLGAFSGDFEIGLGLGRGLSIDAIAAGAAATKAACDELGTRPQSLDARTHVGVIIDDGLKYKKEELLLGALDRNQSLVLVGGGAADPAWQSSQIHVDGEVVDDAVLLALFHTEAPWGTFRAHPYTPTGTTFTITEVDDSGSRAVTIDGHPAAPRFAELTGLSIDDLDFYKPNGFSVNSAALKVGREYFMRGPFKVHPDNSIEFVNLLAEGATLEMMRLGDMVAMTRDFFTRDIPRVIADPRAALFFNCGARAMMAQTMGISEPLGQTFALAPPCVGFNVHFEIYCGFQINSTLTALVFGASA